MVRGVRGSVGVLFILAVTSGAAPAWASEAFPGLVEAAVGMECTPRCTICHLDDMGGYDKIRAGGFGSNLQNRFGLVARDFESVGPAIEAARLAKLDSDGDGMLDVDELAIGRDPSNKDPDAYTCGELASEAPAYGCGSGSRIAPGRAFDAVAVLAAAATLAVGALRARRRTL